MAETVNVAEGDSGVEVLVSTGETAALTDFGRGKREANRLLDAV